MSDSHPYWYIGKNGRPILAGELEDSRDMWKARAEKAEAELKAARIQALKEAADLAMPTEPYPDGLSFFDDEFDRAYWLGQKHSVNKIKELIKQED